MTRGDSDDGSQGRYCRYSTWGAMGGHGGLPWTANQNTSPWPPMALHVEMFLGIIESPPDLSRRRCARAEATDRTADTLDIQHGGHGGPWRFALDGKPKHVPMAPY